MGMENIEHLVVVMFENRSFDNLLGWLYDNETNPPKLNIPDQTPPTFDGLKPNTYSNSLANGEKVFVSRPPTSWPSCPNANQVPTPDPQEKFDQVTFQIFGKSAPGPKDKPDMSGFLQNYSTTDAGNDSVKQIMQTYGPKEANVINELALNFAVCDRWFASVPSQTWPNRGFVHTGSSDGHVNNDNLEWYHIPTIFNVLQDHGKSWAVFYNSGINSFTYLQFPYLGGFRDRIYQYSKFSELCQAQADADPALKLPAYSFVEPRFLSGWFGLGEQPNDYHPPHNICRGEQFLADVYQTIRKSPYRDKIMLVVTFDEHGGCYDHVPPPSGAKAPLPCPVSRDGKFKFNRLGVRVPAIVVSSYVEPGTVFRAKKREAPYDHTSIAATLRDWLELNSDPAKFLPSPRIAAAPTLDRVLIRAKGSECQWPDITAKCTIDASDISADMPLNDVQRGLFASAKTNQSTTHPGYVNMQAKQLKTFAHGASFLQPDASEPN
jgi:phospholipase C